MKNIDELSLSTTVFGKEQKDDDLLYYLETARSAGFSYVELSRKHFNLAKRIQAIYNTGIKVWSIHGCLSSHAISEDSALRRQAIDQEIARINEAAAFGKVPVVEHYLDRMNDPRYGKYFRQAIEKLYEISHQLGVILTIETVPYKPLINERYPFSTEIADFVRSFQADDLLMTIDINHSNLNEDLLKVCENCDSLIANVHMSNNYGLWEDHLPPDKGVIDLPGTFNALRKHGYHGPANLEIHGEETITIEYLKKIYKYTDNILFDKK